MRHNTRSRSVCPSLYEVWRPRHLETPETVTAPPPAAPGSAQAEDDLYAASQERRRSKRQKYEVKPRFGSWRDELERRAADDRRAASRDVVRNAGASAALYIDVGAATRASRRRSVPPAWSDARAGCARCATRPRRRAAARRAQPASARAGGSRASRGLRRHAPPRSCRRACRRLPSARGAGVAAAPGARPRSGPPPSRVCACARRTRSSRVGDGRGGARRHRCSRGSAKGDCGCSPGASATAFHKF